MTTNTALALLRRADEILSEPRRWTKGDMARNIHGEAVDTESVQATCFCLAGAVERAREEIGLSYFVLSQAFSSLVEDAGGISITTFNDRPSTTFGDVKSLLALTISRLEIADTVRLTDVVKAPKG